MSPFFISGKKIKAICVNCKVLRKTFYYVVVVNRVLLQNLLLSDQPTSIARGSRSLQKGRVIQNFMNAHFKRHLVSNTVNPQNFTTVVEHAMAVNGNGYQNHTEKFTKKRAASPGRYACTPSGARLERFRPRLKTQAINQMRSEGVTDMKVLVWLQLQDPPLQKDGRNLAIATFPPCLPLLERLTL